MFFLKNCDKKFILDAFLEVLIGKDENFNILTLRKVYLTKGQKKNNNNVHTCRTVRDTLSRSKHVDCTILWPSTKMETVIKTSA